MPDKSLLMSSIEENPHPSHPSAWVEAAAGVQSIVTIVGIVIAAWWAWRGDWLKSRNERAHELTLRQRENEQRQERLRWDQAKLAREINSGFLDDLDAREVLDLVDSELDSFQTTDSANPEESYTFDLAAREDVNAMRVDDKQFNDKELHLRECFDAWFYWMALMEQHLSSNLIRLEDIEFPSAYYLRCLRSDRALYTACLKYIEYYGISRNIRAFIQRFDDDRRDGGYAGNAVPDGIAGKPNHFGSFASLSSKESDQTESP